MNTFGRGGSSSESSEEEEDELLFPDANPIGGDEFSTHRRKRRKTGRDAKESAALGIFGSESEDERPGRRWKSRSLREKGLAFTKSGEKPQIDEGEESEGSEDDMGELNGGEEVDVDAEDTAGLRGLVDGARGLGFPTSDAMDVEELVEHAPTFSMGTPLGKGWTPSSTRQPFLKGGLEKEGSASPVIRPSFSTPTAMGRQNGKGTGTAAAAAANPNSFAAKMMAKMGYKEGEGLGASGRGRLAPIETQLRPQNVGLGAVKEKTKQAKEEEKREAAFRGEIVEDSSEEERKRRRKQKDKRISGVGSGTSTPGGSRAKPKTKYRTVKEFEAATEGLVVPNVLKSIVDITGKETKLLTSAPGLMTPNESMVPAETESTKIAKRARRDLEAFADEWSGLGDRKKYFQQQSIQLTEELDQQQEEVDRLSGVVDAVRELQMMSTEDVVGNNDDAWESTTMKLEALEFKYQDEIETYGLQEAAVAALHPMFRDAMLSWDPLQNPSSIVGYVQRLRHILGLTSDQESKALQNGHSLARSQTKSTSHYETLIYTLWLPQLRSTITNDWDVHEPQPLITLIEAWRSVLPPFILSNVIDQLIVQCLTTAVSHWKPRNSPRHKSRHSEPPHVWLFPWLPYLSEQHTNPKSHSGLLTDVKRKFRTVLDTWDLAQSVPSWLPSWREVLGSELDTLLLRHLLPRLSAHLQSHFDVNPQDQDLASLEQVFQWTPFFKASTMAHLLQAEFFPKWHTILHVWITSDPSYDEIRQWFLWWKEQIPPSISSHPIIEEEWNKGLEMINHALELGPEASKTDLPPPTTGPKTPLAALSNTPNASTINPALSSPSPKPAAVPEVTFRHVLEDFCSDKDLLLLPLHEAHPTTGLPLFRITASASGRGGVVGYLKGDVLWARERNKRVEDEGNEKWTWRPLGLDDGLVERAGTR